MQELVYLSDAKLRQFVPEGRPLTWLRRLTRARMDVTTPAGGGGVEVELAEPQNGQSVPDRLAAVMKHLDERSLWYQDPGARAGRWVYFEAPFNTVVVETGESSKTVLFLDSMATRANESERDGVGLLLHGSARHLRVDMSSTISRTSLYGIVGSGLHMATRRLESTPPLPAAERLLETEIEPVELPGAERNRFLARFIQASSMSPETAAWMRGYARVTMRADRPEHRFGLPSVLAATPLYVEYAHDLPESGEVCR
ncbi:SAVMC3_10250 family protein [Streptomyces sp. NPDC017673]|uniref:SAVMC3_10250 family protein n=1 Tax=unclassified Streptomyces TaxID=2593676 RepID=UPI0037BD364F